MRARHFVAPMLAVAFAAGCAESPTEADSMPTAVLTAEQPAFVATSSIVTATPPFGGAIIPGAVAELKRFPNGVNFMLKTNGLTAGDAYTLWVAVFNHPSECNVPYACNPGDESNPAVGADLFNGAGQVVGVSGTATFSGRVNTGDTGDIGTGLLDVFGAQIHLAVRNHGPKLPGNAQLSTFNGGCPPNACATVQVAQFLPSFAASAATTQISGVGFFDAGACPAPPTGYEDFITYPGIAMHGSLEGCWYTKVVTSRDNGAPSGVYQERGEEVFVGSFDGGPEGTFTTTYKFSSSWEPDVTNGSEVRGRCQHPIVAGSGTGGFVGATGRLDFKDDVVTGNYFYRGHISLR